MNEQKRMTEQQFRKQPKERNDFIYATEEAKEPKILNFAATPGFGKWKKYYPKESVAHPAKINQFLLEYLISHYTKKGEVILDPMCGTGSTVVLSMLNNRNAIGVDLEAKFTGWATQAVETVEREQTLTPKGKGLVICGDSRKLSEVLKEHGEKISSVLFSPPYASSFKSNPQNREKRIERLRKVDEAGVESGAKWGLCSDEALERLADRQDLGYGGGKGNIGNLPFVDGVVLSPPYAQSTSPFVRGAPLKNSGDLPTINCLNIQDGYSESTENIGNLLFDATILSSPYEKTVKDHGKSDRATKINVEKNNHSSFAYSDDENNIGNQKKESYLEAMKLVYEQCYFILKPRGLMILILKNFIRQKKVVPLTDHTINLCESVGFKLKERLLFKLPQKSFWRIRYEKKFPEVDTSDLQHEHILIFEKI